MRNNVSSTAALIPEFSARRIHLSCNQNSIGRSQVSVQNMMGLPSEHGPTSSLKQCPCEKQLNCYESYLRLMYELNSATLILLLTFNASFIISRSQHRSCHRQGAIIYMYFIDYVPPPYYTASLKASQYKLSQIQRPSPSTLDLFPPVAFTQLTGQYFGMYRQCTRSS